MQAASQRIKGAVQRTPCPLSIPLSELTGCEIFCKLDYLQRTGSFKERGARNALLQLTENQRTRGVITASAGNHALGLAYHGQLLGIPVTVVMPKTAPLTKIANCRHLGAKVILEGKDIGEAREHALQSGSGQEYINGFDHPHIIAGQGTMGLEILEQVSDVDAIVVPVGGGGLIAGIGVVIKQLKPGVEIIAVEPEHCASYAAALSAASPVTVTMRPTIADGLAVPCVGANAFALARQFVARNLIVSEGAISLAVLRLLELERAVVEGAGAVPLAAMLAGLLTDLRGKRVVLPLCGGNIDTNIIGRVIERGLAVDGRLCRFSAVISDRPGGLAAFTELLAQAGVSVHDIAHDRAFASSDLTKVTVHCLVETRDLRHIQQLRHELQHAGFEVLFPDFV